MGYAIFRIVFLAEQRFIATFTNYFITNYSQRIKSLLAKAALMKI